MKSEWPRNTLLGFLSGGAFRMGSHTLKARVLVIFAVLGVLNIGSWLWALIALRGRPVALGLALMTYGLGLRHAVDADHIAAIDNVTRKLVQEGKRSVTVGLYFALGHSALVVIVALIVAGALTKLENFEALRHIGATISVSVSASFLFAIAGMNSVIFLSIYKNYRHLRRDRLYVQQHRAVFAEGGILTRMFGPLFRLVSSSWHMFPLGFLFGLGFDTATEVTMFGVSVEQAAKGVSLLAVMVFPILFAAGMSLIDTTDGVMMLGAYEWAFVTPMRKLYYNMTITATSVAIALLIGGIETLGLMAGRLHLHGVIWHGITTLNENSGNLGFLIIGVFLVGWLASYLLYRIRRLDRVEVECAGIE